MFDHVIRSLPINSTTRVSFQYLNDFNKSSKRVVNLLPDYAQMADYARNVIGQLDSRARDCRNKISWNIIYEHDARSSSLARMRFDMLKKLEHSLRTSSSLYKLFNNRYYEISSDRMEDIQRVVRRLQYGTDDFQPVIVLIMSPKLALKSFTNEILFKSGEFFRINLAEQLSTPTSNRISPKAPNQTDFGLFPRVLADGILAYYTLEDEFHYQSPDFSVQKEFDFLELNPDMERKKSTSRIKECPYLKSTVVFMDDIEENTTCETTKSSFLAGTVADDMKNILSAIVPSIVVTALISVCYCCYSKKRFGVSIRRPAPPAAEPRPVELNQSKGSSVYRSKWTHSPTNPNTNQSSSTKTCSSRTSGEYNAARAVNAPPLGSHDQQNRHEQDNRMVGFMTRSRLRRNDLSFHTCDTEVVTISEADSNSRSNGSSSGYFPGQTRTYNNTFT
ncbi:Oidioi.mRNA.OKI2018_I69.PAR.g11755.t1.cds [Oikopleura dioica]|uniref:Oidioi.mRNA.OKI2018_I69.PAR.g11755.t1.cds n=1 Tax=Oikopleura dioica TaxID=34765 RepID=A0ABN7S3X2_OIKDI|nr:Oidioi.mRNA.OKI2018_I69.PAR.g11755.t1.cds [Oikopleura dioica]